MGAFTNHLIHETSPYLLQHAHNPVNWFPWGEEALEKARAEDKPILLSIGYAACHWCHVMERESFEDVEVASIMNANFINIKVDREERPDLDHIYMTAVQTMTGSGGWPLNVFLTPGKKAFYGGTYFPPAPAYGRSSWTQVLSGVIQAFRNKRGEIESQAEHLTGHLLQTDRFGIDKVPDDVSSPALQFETVFRHLMQSADTKDGGFGKSPKFPQTFSLQFLLRHYFYTHNGQALQQALLSLDKMISGGIYDHLGGGIARYATDSEWLVPHFEKMLYDNALLVIVLSEAFQLTQKPLYAETIKQTIAFFEQEMMSSEGGFFSAMDADSEGIEGKYYVWDKQEIDPVLKEDATDFCKYYDVSEEGNWEHRNILHVLQPLEEFATQHGRDKDELAKTLTNCRAKLLKIRKSRVPPQMDDKILLSWNALMNLACSKAYAALGDDHYRILAKKNMGFMLRAFQGKNLTNWFHTYKSGVSKHPAFLDDYAFLIAALIGLQEITGDQEYLVTAKQLTEIVIDNFSQAETGFFYYTDQNQKDIVLRVKEVIDGATPSGNAIMAWNLHYLSLVFEKQVWRERAAAMGRSLNTMIAKYPTSFGMWSAVLYDIFFGLNEIAVLGSRYREVTSGIVAHFLPNKIIQSAAGDDTRFPLLADRNVKDKTYIYLCRNSVCQQPVETIADLLQLIEKELKR